MDDVPVKISEKYKRFPKIDLPYSINECITRAQKVVDIANAANFSCTFERNVLSKIEELKNAKETKKNERRHRLQLLQEAEQKRLDAIAAAEEEERLKQLNVSEVSYPSTDEIGVLAPEEKADKDCDNITSEANTPEKIEVSTNIDLPPVTVVTEPPLNILQPTLVTSHYSENNLLDDPDPLQNFKLNNKITRITHNPNIDMLTFRDFENDTSSPFDNVELKTINDMELLAQVLQSPKESAVNCQQPTYVVDQSYSLPNCASQAQLEGTAYLPATYMEQPIQGPSMMYNTPQPYPMSNGYYISNNADDVNMYMPNYQYYVPSTSYQTMDTYYGNQLPMTSDIGQVPNDSSYIHQPYYYQYPQLPVQYQTSNTAIYNTPVLNENTEKNLTTASQNTIKSRSRSVPDIVRELNDELEKLKMNERSHNTTPVSKNTQDKQTEPKQSPSHKNKNRINKMKTVQLPNPFDKLQTHLQDVCKKIHRMGFPLDRVARVCTIVGESDKKIIEFLLIVGELMDLGFSEEKVVSALVKHQFNRDKALDELVS